MNDENKVIYNQAVEFFEKKEHKKALELFESIIEVDENNILFLNYIAISYFNLNENEKAYKYFEKCLKIDVNNLVTLHNIISYFFKIKEYIKTIEYSKNILEIENYNINALTLLSLSYFELGDYIKSIEYSLKVINQGNENVIIRINIANCYFKINNFNEAIKYYEDILRRNSSNSKVLTNISLCYKELERYDKALEYTLKQLELDKNNTILLENCSIYCSMLKDYNNALLYAFKILENNKNCLKSLILISLCYFDLNDYINAIKYSQKCLEIDNNIVIILETIIIAYNRLKEYDKTMEYAKKCLEIDNDNIIALENILTIQFTLNEYNKIIEYSEKILKIDENNRKALAFSINTYITRKEFLKAFQYLLILSNNNLMDINIMTYTIQTYLNYDNYYEAFKYCEILIGEYVKNQTIICQKQQEINSLINIIITKAFILYELKKHEEAKETIQNAWSYLKDYKEGNNINTFSEYYYTYSLIIHEENLDEAIESVNKAIKYDDNRYDFYMQAAFYYYLKNDKDLFYENMNKSIELKKTNKDEQFKISFVDKEPIIEKTYKKVKIPEDVFFEMINEIKERKAKEQEIRLQERNKVIADLSHSIKNLIGGSIMASLENLRKEIGDSPLIKNAIKGSELIKRIVTAMNLSFSGSINDFYFDAKNNNESITLKTLITESLKYSTENMFDSKYFSQFKEQYFPTKEIYIHSKKIWDEIINSGDLSKIQNFLNENMINFEYDFDDSINYSIGDEKGSATKLMILFQEIIFNAVKYSSFVVKNERKLIISLKKDKENIIFDIKNSCLTDLVEKSTGLGKEIISNFTKLLQTQPIVKKENNIYSVQIVFKNFWEN